MVSVGMSMGGTFIPGNCGKGVGHDGRKRRIQPPVMVQALISGREQEMPQVGVWRRS